MTRPFDPLFGAVENAGARDAAMDLLAAIAPWFSALDERTAGFVRGMRDKLLTEPAFQPSGKQMDWLRDLAANGPRRRR